MNTCEQLELPGLTARIENGLVVETRGEDQLCGRALAIAKTWSIWQMQVSKNERALPPSDQEHPKGSDLQQETLRKMQTLETLVRGKR